MLNCKPSKVPIPAGFKAISATDAEHEQVKHEPYQAMVGALLYAATITRPDIAFATSLLARHASKWNSSHVHAAKNLLRYVKGTLDLSLTFDETSGQRTILGYADADWGGCLDTRQSTTGYVFQVFGGVVAWRSKRQPTTALSTMEAEYMSSSGAARQAAWLRQLLNDLGFRQDSPTMIYNDNTAAILLAKNPVNHDRAKHIDIIYHHIRDELRQGKIDLSYIPSAQNLADALTKALPEASHSRLSAKLGMTRQKSVTWADQQRLDEGEC